MPYKHRPYRKDENHSEIKKAFEACFAECFDAAQFGFPCDLIVFQGTKKGFVDVKHPDRDKANKKLTPAAVEFDALLRRHGDQIHVVETIEQVPDVLRRMR